jgi:hypothetical protein
VKAQGKYTVGKWEEAPYHQISETSKLTRASVAYQFTGEIEGAGYVEYLMFYSHFDPKDQHKSAAVYVGLIRFEGKLRDKTGSFVLQDQGSFSAGAAVSTLKIMEGSGTGALGGIAGTGSYRADKNGFFIDLEYELS